jgi:hypothetical protein
MDCPFRQSRFLFLLVVRVRRPSLSILHIFLGRDLTERASRLQLEHGARELRRHVHDCHHQVANSRRPKLTRGKARPELPLCEGTNCRRCIVSYGTMRLCVCVEREEILSVALLHQRVVTAKRSANVLLSFFVARVGERSARSCVLFNRHLPSFTCSCLVDVTSWLLWFTTKRACSQMRRARSVVYLLCHISRTYGNTVRSRIP